MRKYTVHYYDNTLDAFAKKEFETLGATIKFYRLLEILEFTTVKEIVVNVYTLEMKCVLPVYEAGFNDGISGRPRINAKVVFGKDLSWAYEVGYTESTII